MDEIIKSCGRKCRNGKFKYQDIIMNSKSIMLDFLRNFYSNQKFTPEEVTQKIHYNETKVRNDFNTLLKSQVLQKEKINGKLHFYLTKKGRDLNYQPKIQKEPKKVYVEKETKRTKDEDVVGFV